MASEFRGLVAWQKAVELAVEIYRATDSFPRTEQFSLTQQMRRAAVSVPCNIAEGRGRSSPRDYRVFVLNARGSVYELETQIEVCKRLTYLSDELAIRLTEGANEVARLVNGIVRSLDKKQ